MLFLVNEVMCSDDSELQEPKPSGTFGEESSEAQHLSPHLRHEMWKRRGSFSDKAEYKHMGKHFGHPGKEKKHILDNIRHKADYRHHHHHVKPVFFKLLHRRGKITVGLME